MLKTQILAKAVWAGLVMLAVFGAIPALAATYTVTSTNDSGTGSLRAALSAATSGSDTITFSLTYPATITLTSDELHIYANVTITGPGASSLTISGGGNFRVFENDSATVSISGLTIANGTGAWLNGVSPAPGVGGAIFNAGTMTLTAVTLTTNTSLEGGAIDNVGTLTVTNSTISNNTAPCGAACNGYGGGIFNYGTLTVSGSTISNNTAGYDGGGIWNTSAGGGSPGTVTITNSTISGNFAIDEGGGISNGSNGTLTITNSTISGNSSPGGTAGPYIVPGQSGGIANQGTATISGSTISGNTTNASGGGIFNNSTGTLTMINSTISGNSSGRGGGGLENIGTMSLSFVTISGNRTNTAGCCGYMADGILNFGIALTVKNSILANSTAIGNCLFYTGYPVTSQGYNLSDDTTCTIGFVQSSDINNTPAGLGTLQNNGGPTQTIALLAGSPAIDAIPVSPTSFCTDVSAAAVTTDQRGITRPQGSACDIGAFEALALLQSQTISFAALPNQAFGTAPLTVSATASSGLAVSFSSQTTSICTTTGTNGATVTLLGVGQCTIQATQGGGGNYAAANPVSRSFQVTQQGQTISFAALPNLPLGAAPFTVSATATSSLAVSFSSQTTSVCTTSGTNGTAVTLVASAVGTCTIQATQGGNTNIAAATPVSRSFQVISLPQLVVTKSLSRNGTISVIVTVTNNGGSAASSVQLTAAKIGATATTTTLPATVGTGTIAGAGGSGQITVSFPGTVGTTGTATTLTLSGTYNGGSFGGTSRITLP